MGEEQLVILDPLLILRVDGGELGLVLLLDKLDGHRRSNFGSIQVSFKLRRADAGHDLRLP